MTDWCPMSESIRCCNSVIGSLVVAILGILGLWSIVLFPFYYYDKDLETWDRPVEWAQLIIIILHWLISIVLLLGVLFRSYTLLRWYMWVTGLLLFAQIAIFIFNLIKFSIPLVLPILWLILFAIITYYCISIVNAMAYQLYCDCC